MNLDDAIDFLKEHRGTTQSKIEDAFDRHLHLVERKVIHPFCDRHNLRFASAMGHYGFCTPSGTVLLPPDEMIERHERDTNQFIIVDDPLYRHWKPIKQRTEEYRDWEPSFFSLYRAVWSVLEHEFGQYVVAFSANDYNSPGYEKNLKKIQARTEE